LLNGIKNASTTFLIELVHDNEKESICIKETMRAPQVPIVFLTSVDDIVKLVMKNMNMDYYLFVRRRKVCMYLYIYIYILVYV